MPELMTERAAPSVTAADPTPAATETLLSDAVAALRELALVDPRGFTLAVSQVTETTDLLLRHARAPRGPRGRPMAAARG